MKPIFLWSLAFFVGCCEAQRRQGKNLGLFQVVKFKNDQCEGSNGKLGTCYTEEECEIKGGVSSGSCAEGYGVCCIFTMNCGGSQAENLTYFESNAQMTGACNAKVCKCASDVCQLRLDFVAFTINGPSTDTEDRQGIHGGSTIYGGPWVADNTRCLTDSFAVTGTATRGGSPVICGTNTGQHIFVDASESCNVMTFHFGDSSNSVNRQWDIRVTQYKCGSMNAAPDGCLQYFYGSKSGYLETFNWANKLHLSAQNQLMCIRQEEGYCQICYSHDEEDFGISNNNDNDDEGYVGSSDECCNYYYSGSEPYAFDCAIIRNPTTKNGGSLPDGNGHFCGENLVTDNSATTAETVCTKITPFQVRFLSDTGDHEYEFNKRGNTGFKLYFEQFSC